MLTLTKALAKKHFVIFHWKLQNVPLITGMWLGFHKKLWKSAQMPFLGHLEPRDTHLAPFRCPFDVFLCQKYMNFQIWKLHNFKCIQNVTLKSAPFSHNFKDLSIDTKYPFIGFIQITRVRYLTSKCRNPRIRGEITPLYMWPSWYLILLCFLMWDSFKQS